MFSLEGKLALVTGGAGSMGRAICLALAEAGADLVIADQRRLPAENTAEKVRAFRRFTLVWEADMTDPAQVQSLIRAIPEELPGRTPDILVLNLAVADAQPWLEGLSAGRWDDPVTASLAGAAQLSQAALPALQSKSNGRIILVSPLLVALGDPPPPLLATIRLGVVEFTQRLARQLAPFRVTVNAVLPGLISDGSYYRLADEVCSRLTARVPLGYVGEPRDVAALVAFLASPEARYITGAVIPVAGGFLFE